MTVCDFYSLATNRGSFPGSRAGRSWSSDSDGKYKARVLVVDDEELHTGWELRAEVVELGFYVVGDLHGVGAGLAEDLDADDVLAGSAFAVEG